MKKKHNDTLTPDERSELKALHGVIGRLTEKQWRERWHKLPTPHEQQKWNFAESIRVIPDTRAGVTTVTTGLRRDR